MADNRPFFSVERSIDRVREATVRLNQIIEHLTAPGLAEVFLEEEPDTASPTEMLARNTRTFNEATVAHCLAAEGLKVALLIRTDYTLVSHLAGQETDVSQKLDSWLNGPEELFSQTCRNMENIIQGYKAFLDGVRSTLTEFNQKLG